MGKQNYNFIDLSGQVFDRWTILTEILRGKHGQVRWLCRCECGIERPVNSQNLRRGLSRSCGCLASEINSKRTKGVKTGRIPHNFKDMSRQKFGRWTVLVHVESNMLGHAGWLCRCDCGTERVVDSHNLRSGLSTSCGCFCREQASKAFTTHGMTGSVEYTSWAQMMARCYNKTNGSYKNYGGRGILVADEWHIFENFFADMGLKGNSSLTLERKNVELGYSKSNCAWADRLTQGRNKRSNVRVTYENETFVLSEWAERKNIPYKTLHARVKAGWSFEDAITRPLGNNNRQGRNKKIK